MLSAQVAVLAGWAAADPAAAVPIARADMTAERSGARKRPLRTAGTAGGVRISKSKHRSGFKIEIEHSTSELKLELNIEF